MPPSPVEAARRHRRWWQALRFVIGLALAGLAFFALNGQRNELVGASSELAHLRVGWVVVGAAAEICSFVCFGALQRRLVQAGGVHLSLRQSTGLSLAAGAIASSIPAGPAFASVFAFRFYRRHGANDALAGWALLATLVCAALSLGLVATAGVALAARESASYDLVGVILGVLAITVVADAIVLKRGWLAWILTHLLLACRKLTGRPRRHGLVIVEEYSAKLAAVQLRFRDLLATIAFGMSNWLFDCAALLFSFLAVGAPIPWRGLLLAYGAAQLAANLPVTPGGLGVVEGSLTVALVAFGGAERSTVTAVLCYRIISFWGYLPVGWASWLGLEFTRRREERRLAIGLHPSSVLSGAARAAIGLSRSPASPSEREASC